MTKRPYYQKRMCSVDFKSKAAAVTDPSQIEAAMKEVYDQAIGDASKVLKDWLKYYDVTIFPPVPEEMKAKGGVAADLLRDMMPRMINGIDALKEDKE